ncbi:MAG: tRNA (adenosine(37)-N6)-threonylcarbamoyltransferase complex dimerization subunit type 1 TsaB [Casimicrobiaceae bacterium]
MRILALDTSTEWLSVAAGDGVDWHSLAEHARSTNSERILPAIDAVLAQARWTLRDLDGIAFGAGPGAFTGVRIACSVAQGLAFGADLPVVPVSTLAALAQAAWRARGALRVLGCLDARMREVYVGAYERVGERWHEALEPAVLKPDEVRLPPGAGWQGEGDGFAAYPQLAALAGLTNVDGSARPDAVAIGELALPELAAGRGVAAADALPIYVRHRVALTAAERAAGARL